MPTEKKLKLDLGFRAEGVVELDPMTGRLVIRCEDVRSGGFIFLDLQEHLEKYKGEEVRCILTPLKSVQEIAKLVDSGVLRMEDVPKVPQFE